MGKTKVIKYSGEGRFLCQCECGMLHIANGYNLSTGRAANCRQCKDGMHKNSESKIYGVWASIKQRCYNFNNNDYHNYGGRGITMCPNWKKSFINFYQDMSATYREGLSIDRIDNNKGYYLENCRWADKRQQNQNRRDNVIVAINRKTKCVAEWCKYYKIKQGTVYSRMSRGWDVAKAVTTPITRIKNKSPKTARGLLL